MTADSIAPTVETNNNQPTPLKKLWGWLKQRVDFSKYIPSPCSGILIQEFTGKKGVYYVAKSPSSQYLKMEPPDFFLWSQMDGKKTIADITVAYFFQFQAFAFARIRTLVSNLRQKGFLEDPPTQLYGKLEQHFREQNKVATVGNRFVQAFMQHEISIRGLDGILARAYQSFVKFFYLPIMIWLYWFISIAGMGVFIYTLTLGKYALLDLQGSVGLDLILLYVGILLSALFHEAAHAFTVKHYGREVRRGGAMIYMGSLAFYIDTQDIWLAQKKARIAVSWAGPFMNLILGGILAFIIFLFPNFALNALFFKLSFVMFITAILNLNPLIELDGYFILMDWLEMPSLRKRSLAFLQEKLFAKIKAREKFASDERIFLVFGLLALVYTVYTVGLAALVFQNVVWGILVGMWNSPNILLKIGAVALGLVAVVPILYSLLSRIFKLILKAVNWLIAKGFFANSRNVAVLLLLPAILAYGIPGLLGYGWEAAEFIDLGILLVGVIALLWIARHYDRSSLQKAILALGAPLFVFLAEKVIIFLSMWHLTGLAPIPLMLLQTTGILGYVFMTYLSFDADNLKFASKVERTLTAALLILGVVVGPLVSVRLLSQSLPFEIALLAGMVSGITLVNLGLYIPILGSFWNTQFRYTWAFIGLAFVFKGGVVVLNTLFASSDVISRLFSLGGTLGNTFLVGGILLYQLTQTEISTQPFASKAGAGTNLATQLTVTVQYLTEILLFQYRSLFGERRLETLQRTLNAMSVSARWGVMVDRCHLTVYANLENVSVASLALIYQQFMDQLIALLEQGAGQRILRQTLQRAYDHLPWESREVLNEYVLFNTTWGSWLSHQFKETQQDYVAILGTVPLFFQCNPEEVKAISARTIERLYPAGETIIRQGDTGNEFFIVKSGKVAVWQKDANGWDRLVNEHSRGGTFGEAALLHDAPRNATCIAVTPVAVLVLDRAEFQLVKHFFEIKEKLESSIQNVQVLRQIPLFAEIPPEQLKQISSHLKTEAFAADQIVMREGEPGDKFYIIAKGQVEVGVVRPDGQPEVIARRGPGEYVGEVALLMNIPRTASVRALGEVTCLTLTREEFLQLAAQAPEFHQGLERVSSRRMYELKYRSLEDSPVLGSA